MSRRSPTSKWAAVEAMLPGGADAALFRIEAERIARNTPLELEERRQQYLSRAQLCADIVRALPDLEHVCDKATVAQQFSMQRDECKARADFIARHKRRSRFWQHFELLALGEHMGLHLGYGSPSEKRQSEHRWPEPHGPGIVYLQNSAAAIGAPVGAHQALDLLKTYARMKMSTEFNGAGKLLPADATVMKPIKGEFAAANN
jgi:hypothetical protein